MSKVVEKSLIIKKETPFDKLREALLMMFFKEEYYLEKRLEELTRPKSINISNIVIPKEIKI